MIPRAARFVDDRLAAASFARGALDKIFPTHFSFLFGEIALYSFVVLVLTGVYLSFFFDPSLEKVIYQGEYAPLRGLEMSAAYRSALDISFEVRAGLVMRQIHHWAALVFLAAIVIHLSRVFFTGAFRRPREINWIVGVTLLVLSLANGFAGYSLLDDLLSGTGLRIAYSLAQSIPFAGNWIAFGVFGGEFPAETIISRLFVIHILLLPGAIAALLSVHLAIIWRQKHTHFPGAGRSDANIVGERLWPVYAAKSTALFLFVFAVTAALGGLAQINPVWLYGPYHPATVTTAAQPDWYVGWIEGALRLFPPWEVQVFGITIANPFFPGVLLPAVTFGCLYAWPFIERRVTRDYAEHHVLDRPRDRPVRTGVGVAALTFYTLLFLAGGDDVLALVFDVPVTTMVWTLRVAVLTLPLGTGLLAFKWCRDLGPRRVSHAAGIVLLVVGLAAGLTFVRGPERAEADSHVEQAPTGEQLWQQDCAVCHGTRGEGSHRGPDITEAGLAAVDFQLSTGRMPLDDPQQPTRRREPRYDDAQIDLIVDHVSGFVDGPAIPTVDVEAADLAAGADLYLRNCASCHQTAGGGGVLAYGKEAPALRASTPVEVVESMRTGPGLMPVFGEHAVDAREAADIAAYVEYLRQPRDRGGLSLGRLGPVPEGAVAVVVGLGVLVVIARWLGTRRPS